MRHLTTEFEVEFGDCDPAGIVFYPRFFAWFDATFQRWLRASDIDQASIRSRFDAVGTGLIDARASFKAPVRPGDRLTVSLISLAWQDRVLTVGYEGRVGGKTVIEGEEMRGMFVERDGRLRLAPLDGLRDLLGE